MDFQEIYESSRNISSILEEISINFAELNSNIRKYFFDDKPFSVRESIRGEKYYKKILEICQRINKLIKELRVYIEKGTKKDKNDFDELTNEINEMNTPYILATLKGVFTGKKFDDDDKEKAHKICTAYKQLVDQYINEVNNYNALHNENASKPKELTIPSKDELRRK